MRTQEHRARVVGGTFRQNAYFFETYPVALHLLPDPRNAAYRSKRQWEKAMFQTRNLIAMLRDDYPHKMTLLYMYVHTLLRRNSATQALFVARIEHPLSAEQTYEDWMRSLIAFLVQQVFPIGRHGRQDMTEYFGPDVRGGAVSQDTFMPGHGMNHEEEAATQESFPFLDRDREDMMEASPELRIEQELDMILQKKNDEDQARQALLSKARTRRTIPGAESTFSKFKSDFEKLRIQANMNLQGAMPRPSSSEPSIPEYVDRIRVSVQTRFPDIDEKLLHVVTGALAAYRLRLTDLHVRELVMFLWIVEGDVHMRCHDGNIFFFRDGAFRLHRGVPPQSTLARCKKFFLRLEGIFRLMGSARLVTDENVREEVDKLLRENNGPNSLLNSCEDAARGHIPARARRGRSVVGEEMDAQADVVQGERYSSRCQGTADSLTKASGVLQGKLLEDKIFHLVVEWCDSPQERTSGIAYADCAVVYDKDGQNCSFVQGQASDNFLAEQRSSLGCSRHLCLAYFIY